jgi:hypothetical protein
MFPGRERLHLGMTWLRRIDMGSGTEFARGKLPIVTHPTHLGDH